MLASNSAVTTTNYYFANNELVAKKNNDGSIYYIHNDHLGSSSVITNSSGSLVEATSYDPWGKVLSGATKSKFAYTGQERDNETGLDYYNARYYSPDIHRFTQPDPVIADVYNPQMLNRYSYVLNNPLRYTDPTGNQSLLSSLISTVTNAVKSAISFVSNLVSGSSQSTKQSSTNSKSSTPPTSAPANNIPGLSGVKTTVSGLSGNTTSLNSKTPDSNKGVILPTNIPSNANISNNMNQAAQNKLNIFWFKGQVETDGPQDYKSIKRYGPDASQYQDFGNFNYGAVAEASGYSENFAQSMAGAYQIWTNVKRSNAGLSSVPSYGKPFLEYPFGDDYSDQFWIMEGYHYADNR